MQGSSQAYDHNARTDEEAALRFKRFILDETQTLDSTPEADLYRVQLLTRMLDRYDDYTANGALAEAAYAYVLREFSGIRERMRSEGFGEYAQQEQGASVFGLLSEEEAARYIRECDDAAHKRAIGIALCCACVAPLMLITGVDELLTAYAGDVSSLLGICAMFGTIATGVYAIVTAKKPDEAKKIRKGRFSLSAALRKKLTAMKDAAEEKARKKRGRGVALLVACVLPIFLGALMDELWHSWTNDGFAMLGVGGMFAMIGAGVYELITADAEKKSISALLKD